MFVDNIQHISLNQEEMSIQTVAKTMTCNTAKPHETV